MRRNLLIISVTVILLTVVFIFLFSPIVFQEGNPIKIFKGIIYIQVFDKDLVSISNDENKFITKSKNGEDVFIQYMNKKGCTFKEQLGAGYIFEKNESRITVTSRQYSKYFIIWDISK